MYKIKYEVNPLIKILYSSEAQPRHLYSFFKNIIYIFIYILVPIFQPAIRSPTVRRAKVMKRAMMTSWKRVCHVSRVTG